MFTLKVYYSLHFLLIILPLLLSVAFLTLAERQIMASMQRRVGPQVWGFYGLLQPFLDGLKLILKEQTRPSNADTPLYVIAPALTLTVSLLAWAVFPDSEGVVFANLYLSAFFLLMVSSLGVYGLMLAGWSSNSVYAFLGCCRAIAQMISYELSLSIMTLTVCMVYCSVNLSSIVSWQNTGGFSIMLLFPISIMWFICCLAETNRAPFDLTEAEAELVAGFHTEYSGMGFALFMISEYCSIFMMALFCNMLFFGGLCASSLLWALQMSAIVFVFIWVRATLPRYRYDQLMRLGWKTFLPLSLAFFLLNAGFLSCFETFYL
jgi:NADH-quinone oxidoreductase subunit H